MFTIYTSKRIGKFRRISRNNHEHQRYIPKQGKKSTRKIPYVRRRKGRKNTRIRISYMSYICHVYKKYKKEYNNESCYYTIEF